MRSKLAGLILLAAVILAAGGYYLFTLQGRTEELSGYLGGEKTGLFEDEEILSILKEKYYLEFTYSKAGSLDMVTADQSGMNYLFPSSQTALSYYQDCHGQPARSEIIFNTPIVLYTYREVLDALTKAGVITEQDGVYYADMEKLTDMLLSGTQWADIGLSELYGSVTVDTTDPVKSNSGNMFAALLANVLNGGNTVDEESAEKVLPDLQAIFATLGYMETSSADLFSQFLRMGIGARPIIAGYESQLLEFAAENPEDYAAMADDVVMVYPSPTVWSTHVYIALDEAGAAGIDALLDEEIQRLAWEKHGFRTSGYGTIAEAGGGVVPGVAEEIIRVTNVPDYPAMKKIMDGL